MEQDLTQTRYDTFEELEQYCYRAASVIGLICICIFGYDRAQNELAIDSAVAMGKALQITNIMRDVKEDAERGRIYLAREDLARLLRRGQPADPAAERAAQPRVLQRTAGRLPDDPRRHRDA